MKRINTPLALFSCLLVLLAQGCKKPERDNPADTKNPKNIAAAANTATTAVVVAKPALKFAGYELYSDPNHNGQVDAGETVLIKVKITNTGQGQATKVRALIGCDCPTSEIMEGNSTGYYDSGDAAVDYIGPGKTGYQQLGSYMEYLVGNNTLSNTTVNFSMYISDDAGDHWSDSFKIIIH